MQFKRLAVPVDWSPKISIVQSHPEFGENANRIGCAPFDKPVRSRVEPSAVLVQTLKRFLVAGDESPDPPHAVRIKADKIKIYFISYLVILIYTVTISNARSRFNLRLSSHNPILQEAVV